MSQTNNKNNKSVKKIVVVALVFSILFSPFIISLITDAKPYLTFDDDTIVDLDRFSGVCHAGYNETKEEYDIIHQLGVDSIRVDFSWDKMQPNSSAEFNFTRWDEYLVSTTSNGTDVLALLNFDTDWLNQTTQGHYIAPENLDYFLNYVNATLRHFIDNVTYWELWNEPNHATFWDGPAEDYYLLCEKSLDLVHEIEVDLGKDIYIIAGVTAGSMPSYIDGLFSRGLLTYADAISFHPYNTYSTGSFYTGIKQNIEVGRKYGFTGDVWITEMGYPSGGNAFNYADIDEAPSKLLKNYVIGSGLGLTRMIIYTFEDSSLAGQLSSPWNSENYFGLLYHNLTWKPCAYAYSLFSHNCGTSQIRPDLINKNGGFAGNDLVSVLYRKPDGSSTLIMWYEPSFYEADSAVAKVELNLGSSASNIKTHDISTGVNESLSENTIEVGNKPVFITFNVSDSNEQISLKVSESGFSILIYTILLGSLGAAIMAMILIQKKTKRI